MGCAKGRDYEEVFQEKMSTSRFFLFYIPRPVPASKAVLLIIARHRHYLHALRGLLSLQRPQIVEAALVHPFAVEFA